MYIYIRSEKYPNEFRTPLIPEDIKRLKMLGHLLVVEKSDTRCFANHEYLEAGGTLITEEWFKQGQQTLIVGLKKLENIEKLNRHTHVYFSHSLKSQTGSTELLQAFKDSRSVLFDLEYFTDNNGKRLLAFGYYAGLVGTIIGLRQYYNKLNGLQDIANLKPWLNYEEMVKFYRPVKCNILVIGNGRCSKGVQTILQKFNIDYSIIKRGEEINLRNYDILINCISLDPDYNKVWIDLENIDKELLIIDISCDYSKKNNPIPIYSEPTTWEKPVFNYKNHVSLIAIDNLPSLLPRESSTEFSKHLTNLIINYGDTKWSKALDVFQDRIRVLPTP